MNFICKIVEDFPQTRQLSAKFCRQNSLKSIDEYPAYSIDYDRLDFTNYDSFVHSLLLSGHQIIIDQLVSEPSLPSNLEVEETNSTDIVDNLNKILCRDGREIVPSESYYYKMLAKKSLPDVTDLTVIDEVLNKEEITDILNKIDLHSNKKEGARNKDGTYIADDPATPDVNEAWVTSEQPKKKTRRTRKKSSTDS